MRWTSKSAHHSSPFVDLYFQIQITWNIRSHGGQIIHQRGIVAFGCHWPGASLLPPKSALGCHGLQCNFSILLHAWEMNRHVSVHSLKRNNMNTFLQTIGDQVLPAIGPESRSGSSSLSVCVSHPLFSGAVTLTDSKTNGRVGTMNPNVCSEWHRSALSLRNWISEKEDT